MSSGRSPFESDYQVGPGMWTVLRYRVFDAENEQVEDAASEFGFVFGYGAILPRLEATLEGATIGARRSVLLSPDDAYGRRDPAATIEVDRSEFPADVEEGDRYEAETEDGCLIVLRVLSLTPDVVVIDQNHPLAGQRVRFELTVQEVRPASAAELQQAEERLLADQSRDQGAQGPGSDGLGPLIPARSLLRGPSRRYEKGPARGSGSDGANGSAPDPDSEPGNGD
jgi:FKBP-type peptidyl-prolyl cis-trans isomerase SlyD